MSASVSRRLLARELRLLLPEETSQLTLSEAFCAGGSKASSGPVPALVLGRAVAPMEASVMALTAGAVGALVLGSARQRAWWQERRRECHRHRCGAVTWSAKAGGATLVIAWCSYILGPASNCHV